MGTMSTIRQTGYQAFEDATVNAIAHAQQVITDSVKGLTKSELVGLVIDTNSGCMVKDKQNIKMGKSILGFDEDNSIMFLNFDNSTRFYVRVIEGEEVRVNDQFYKPEGRNAGSESEQILMPINSDDNVFVKKLIYDAVERIVWERFPRELAKKIIKGLSERTQPQLKRPME